jgi:DNA-3-methyladenine glycosylase
MTDEVGWSFLGGPSWEVAPRLLGCELERELDGQILRGRIVETEAYDQTDAASHSYHGRTPRTDVMFGPSGHLYVYFTYGMHYCCNIVTGPEGQGSAVLVRALEPIEGAGRMSANRQGVSGHALTNGPAKLCQALAIDKKLNGHDLQSAPLRLIVSSPIDKSLVEISPRIGITQAKDVFWRYYIKGNDYISR